MKKYLLLVSLVIVFANSNNANGQAYSRIFKNKMYDTIPQRILKVNPFMFFAPFSHISISGEFRVKPYSSIQVELGYITQIFTESVFYNQINEGPYQGFRINPEWRFYSPVKSYTKFYLGPEVYFQQIYRKQQITYGVGCADGSCDYWQSGELNHTQMRYGFNFIAGYQGAPVGLPFFDFFAGIGVRVQRNYYGNEPVIIGGQVSNNDRLESYSSTPFITIGVKLGLVLDK